MQLEAICHITFCYLERHVQKHEWVYPFHFDVFEQVLTDDRSEEWKFWRKRDVFPSFLYYKKKNLYL